MELFNNEWGWFKGNLHTHTTLSDGKASPEESIRLYRDAGYHFLAITDHSKYYRGAEESGLLLLNSTEYDRNDFITKRAYHITGIAPDEDPGVEEAFTPQEIIDAIRQKNGLAIIAHPAWSLLTHEDLVLLKNYTGIEIWNSVSETHSCRGDSVNHADVLASKGKIPLVFAVDDTHFYEQELFGGYIMVNSRTLSQKDILDSIQKGRFYCSQGPIIKQISMEDGVVSAEVSPVKELRFISDTFYCHDRVCRRENGMVTGGTYEIKPTDTFVRVECLDENGKKAWSQFLSLQK